MGLSKGLSCKTGSFFCCHSPHRFLQLEVLKLYFPVLEPWIVFSHSPVVPPGLFACECGTAWSASCRLIHLVLQPCLAMVPLCPGCWSPPLLPVWVNIFSLTPCLLEFHTIQFSGSSGCFLFLNLLFSFFWMCKEAKCIYLCLHLGQKSESDIF